MFADQNSVVQFRIETYKNVDPNTAFDLFEELGKGKFGRVLRCQDKITKEFMAAKIVMDHKKARSSSGEIREVEILRAVGRHPQIAGLHSVYEYRSRVYLFTELILGGVLYDRLISEDDLDEKIALYIVHQMLLGLMHLKKCFVLHLDLKPDNVMMVAPTGYDLKLVDFGMATFYDPKRPSRQLGGTCTYTAPETINYEFQTFQTDIWSLGVMTYEILSGITPFEIPHEGDRERKLTTSQISTNIIKCRYDFEDEGIRDVSEDAKNFIRDILKKNPNDRPTVEDCLEHPWIFKLDQKSTMKRNLSLRRRNKAKEMENPTIKRQGDQDLKTATLST